MIPHIKLWLIKKGFLRNSLAIVTLRRADFKKASESFFMFGKITKKNTYGGPGGYIKRQEIFNLSEVLIWKIELDGFGFPTFEHQKVGGLHKIICYHQNKENGTELVRSTKIFSPDWKTLVSEHYFHWNGEPAASYEQSLKLSPRYL